MIGALIRPVHPGMHALVRGLRGPNWTRWHCACGDWWMAVVDRYDGLVDDLDGPFQAHVVLATMTRERGRHPDIVLVDEST